MDLSSEGGELHKRYVIHVGLGILMRHVIGAGTSKKAAARGPVGLLVVHHENSQAIILFAVPDTEGNADFGILIVTATPK